MKFPDIIVLFMWLNIDLGLGCDILQNCSPNAECIYDEDKGIYECRCLDGFSGDGIDCNENVIEGTGDVEEG